MSEARARTNSAQARSFFSAQRHKKARHAPGLGMYLVIIHQYVFEHCSILLNVICLTHSLAGRAARLFARPFWHARFPFVPRA
jgi:hypothetical protein